MGELSKFLVDSILNETVEQVTALFGGGFKPPTKGHLEVVLKGLQQNPEITQLKILVGAKERAGFTQKQAVKIWNFYNDMNLIPVDTTVIPVGSPYDYYKKYLKQHSKDKVYIFIGSREGNEDDQLDVQQRTKYIKKYSDNVIPLEISTQGSTSGTEARKLFKTDISSLRYLFPENLTDGDFKKILNILGKKDLDEGNITEIENPLYYDFQIRITPGGSMGITFLHKDGRIQKSTTSHDDNPLAFNYKEVPSMVKAAYKLKNDKSEIVIWDDMGKGKGYPLTPENIKLIKRQSLNESTENNLNLNIPEDILQLHRAFIKNGKKLYVVGGAVRDAILGKDPKDYDLATDATPDEVLSIAEKEGLKTLEIGKQFGVVIVNGHEIATFRKDIGKGRRPDSVEYTDIEGDVNRRDLTINALFYDIDKGEVVDLVGGVKDLRDKKIRTVGKASERFEEDALRKLRALRFHGQTGGELGKETLQALKDNPSLEGISGERIRDEFVKGLKKAISTKKYLETADELGYLNQILPNLTITLPYIDEEDYIVLLAYLLKDNLPTNISKQLNQLKYSGEEAKQISFLSSLNDFNPNKIQPYKKLQKISNVTDEQINKIGKLIGKDFTKFLNFELSVRGNEVPSGLKGPEIGDWVNKQEISNYHSLNENNDPFGLIQLVNEISKEEEFDYSSSIDSLTNYMLDKGMKITPLPEVTFTNDDVENAQDVMGKTAFYDPNKREIVLYTLLRHPKDVLRSYAHEMIHHLQNLEGRLENITTTNTQEDDHLKDIESEAYTDGNLTFRGWTDTILNEDKKPLAPQEKVRIFNQNCNCG